MRAVKWGEMNSLTGVSAAPAKTLQMGYEEQIEYVNANGGINGGQIESVNLDDKSDMSASVSAVTQLMNQEKVAALIGPFPQMVATAARSISEKGGTPHMLYAPPTIADLTNTEYKWSFLCSTGPDGVADALLKAAEVQGYKSIVAIADVIPIHQESLVIMEQYYQTRASRSSQCVPRQVDLAATDVSPIVAKLAAAAKAEKPDALYILSNPIHVPAIQKGLKALGERSSSARRRAPRRPSSCRAPRLSKASWLSAPASPIRPSSPADYPGKDDIMAFAERFTAKYNQPPDFYAGFAYDAVHLMANATAAGNGNDKEATRTALENTTDSAGCQGVFNYSATDHVGIHGELLPLEGRERPVQAGRAAQSDGLVIKSRSEQ